MLQMDPKFSAKWKFVSAWPTGRRWVVHHGSNLRRPISKFFQIQFSFQDFLETKIKIIFQDFGNKILKMNLEKKSRSFFKILAKICLNKIIDFTT